MVKIKNCPFCGGKASIRTVSNGYSGSHFSITAEISCPNCKYSMRGETEFEVNPFMELTVHKGCDGIAKMIKKWNTRKPMDKIIEEMKDVDSLAHFDSLSRDDLVKELIYIVKKEGENERD